MRTLLLFILYAGLLIGCASARYAPPTGDTQAVHRDRADCTEQASVAAKGTPAIRQDRVRAEVYADCLQGRGWKRK